MVGTSPVAPAARCCLYGIPSSSSSSLTIVLGFWAEMLALRACLPACTRAIFSRGRAWCLVALFHPSRPTAFCASYRRCRKAFLRDDDLSYVRRPCSTPRIDELIAAAKLFLRVLSWLLEPVQACLGCGAARHVAEVRFKRMSLCMHRIRGTTDGAILWLYLIEGGGIPLQSTPLHPHCQL